jgi:hypothetical protein
MFRRSVMKWSDLVMTPAKDKAMPKTEEHYLKVLAMDDELIHELKEEISELKRRNYSLEQRLKKRS